MHKSKREIILKKNRWISSIDYLEPLPLDPTEDEPLADEEEFMLDELVGLEKLEFALLGEL